MTDVPPANTPSHRVLVVDDEDGMRQMLSLLLSKHGYDVREAADGREALGALARGDIDLVLADVRMPDLDGLAFLQRIHEGKIPVTVIMMSAFVDLDTAIAALNMGASDYVSKPFKADEVLLKIRMAEERTRLNEERLRLQAENARLQRSNAAAPPQGIVGRSPRLTRVLDTIAKVADYKSTVLLLGESGTGKELVAHALHKQSTRAGKPFVAINCGAIPETLLESELFGHVKGAFTDATRTKAGLIHEADGGTLFLDEIGELPPSLQVKLLRFLQEEEIRPVGSTKGVRLDVRVVAATARNLADMVKAGTFRDDLFYRLNVLQLTIPPLRERKDDIPLLVDHFLHKYGPRLRRPSMSVSHDAIRALTNYDWPGNIRELENAIERAMVLAEGDRIGIDDLTDKIAEPSPNPYTVLGDDLSIKKACRAVERDLIRRALEKTAGNRTHAAKLLEISHRALLYKIKLYALG